MEEKRAHKVRKSGGGRKKLKPEYDAGKNLKEQMESAVALYNTMSLQDSKSGGEADRILSGAAGGAAAFFIYYGKNGFGSKNRRSMRDTGKYQRGYQGDTVAGGSSGHRDREEGLCGQ